MAVNPISSNIVNLLSPSPLSDESSSLSGSGSFADIFTQSLQNVAETDAADKDSSLGLLSGQSDDMVGMLLDAQKAEMSLSLALSLRNKVLDAYSEIMRMQI